MESWASRWRFWGMRFVLRWRRIWRWGCRLRCCWKRIFRGRFWRLGKGWRLMFWRRWGVDRFWKFKDCWDRDWMRLRSRFLFLLMRERRNWWRKMMAWKFWLDRRLMKKLMLWILIWFKVGKMINWKGRNNTKYYKQA